MYHIQEYILRPIVSPCSLVSFSVQSVCFNDYMATHDKGEMKACSLLTMFMIQRIESNNSYDKSLQILFHNNVYDTKNSKVTKVMINHYIYCLIIPLLKPANTTVTVTNSNVQHVLVIN